MVAITLPRHVFEGPLPSVCALTGEEATVTKNLTADNPIGVAFFGIIFGLLPFVILRLILRKQVTGNIPFNETLWRTSEPVVARQKLALSVLVGGVVLAVLTVVGASQMEDVSTGDALRIVGLILAACLALGALSKLVEGPQKTLRMVFNDGPQTVTIKNVHPRFAEAIQAIGVGGTAAWQLPGVQIMYSEQDFAHQAGFVPHGVQQQLGFVPHGVQQQPSSTARPVSNAAWHTDPHDPRQLRYWDGQQWTSHVAAYEGTVARSPEPPRWGHAPIE